MSNGTNTNVNTDASSTTSSAVTLDNFVALSAVLTGYSEAELNPDLDPMALAQEYFDLVQAKTKPSLFDQLLTTFAGIVAGAGGDPAKIASGVQQQILLPPDPCAGENIGDLARRIMRLWYLSIWYVNEPPGLFGPGDVVSSNAYTRGLAWDAMQAHPMGFSEMHFGYWADAPSPLPDGTTGVVPPRAPTDQVPPQPPQRGGI